MLNNSAGTEKYYVRIPRSAVGKVFIDEMFLPQAEISDVQLSPGIIKMEIREGVFHTLDGQELRANIYPMFGFNMACEKIGTGSIYDILARKFVKEQRIRKKPDNEYWTAFKKTILYWDGDGWVKTPTMNKRYLEAYHKSALSEKDHTPFRSSSLSPAGK